MDRSLIRAPYDLGPSNEPTSRSEPATWPTTSISAVSCPVACQQQHEQELASSSTLASQSSQPVSAVMPHSHRLCALLPSPSANESRTSWLQPHAPHHPENPASTVSLHEPIHGQDAASGPPAAANYPHQIHGVGGPAATAPFLRDLNLVAEAAKRAQMSVVMRDLESVTL